MRFFVQSWWNMLCKKGWYNYRHPVRVHWDSIVVLGLIFDHTTQLDDATLKTAQKQPSMRCTKARPVLRKWRNAKIFPKLVHNWQQIKRPTKCTEWKREPVNFNWALKIAARTACKMHRVGIQKKRSRMVDFVRLQTTRCFTPRKFAAIEMHFGWIFHSYCIKLLILTKRNRNWQLRYGWNKYFQRWHCK